MEYTDIVNIIGSLGFPIAMCTAFFVWFTKDYKSEQEKTREVLEDLKETIVVLKSSVEAFTSIASRKYKEDLDKIKEDK